MHMVRCMVNDGGGLMARVVENVHLDFRSPGSQIIWISNPCILRYLQSEVHGYSEQLLCAHNRFCVSGNAFPPSSMLSVVNA